MDTQRAFLALAQPTRFRIIQLLADAPRTVGEVADALGARQPQTTKHLQTLAAADLIVVYRLGRRRVAALQRGTFRELCNWLDSLATEHSSESVLDEYQAAIEAEEARTAANIPGDRIIDLRHRLHASTEKVWRAWTEADIVRHWWAPEHFEVTACDVQATAGGQLRIVMREGDGAEYTATGRFLDLQPPSSLQFELSPLAPDGSPLFASTFNVSLENPALDEDEAGTDVKVTIDITDVRPEAASAVAGVEIGWRHNLDRLATLLALLEHLELGAGQNHER